MISLVYPIFTRPKEWNGAREARHMYVLVLEIVTGTWRGNVRLKKRRMLNSTVTPIFVPYFRVDSKAFYTNTALFLYLNCIYHAYIAIAFATELMLVFCKGQPRSAPVTIFDITY